jgi:hypothetical protein
MNKTMQRLAFPNEPEIPLACNAAITAGVTVD